MRRFVTSWAIVIGLGLITAGAGQYSAALGLIVGGLSLILVALNERYTR